MIPDDLISADEFPLQNTYLCLKLGALLLFGKTPERFKPVFIIKAVSFFGDAATGTKYRDSEDIAGNLDAQFTNGIVFLMRNLKKMQKD